MRKIAFFTFLFFLLPFVVFAKNLELEDLVVNNGEFSIPFNKLNNEYTVLLEKEEYHLELEYTVDDGVTVEVKDNHDLVNNSIVTISLTDEKNSVEYHLHILKEEEETYDVFLEDSSLIETNFMFEYKNYIIPTVCLFCVFIFYKIIFHHKK